MNDIRAASGGTDGLLRRVFTSGFLFLLVFTIGTHLTTLVGLRYVALHVALMAAIGAAGWGILRPFRGLEAGSLAVPTIRVPSKVQLLGRPKALLAGAGVCGLFLLLLGVQYKTSVFFPLWLFLVVVGGLVAFFAGRSAPLPQADPAEPSDGPLGNSDRLFLIACVAMAAFYFLTSIPDTDDTLLLNFAVSAKEAKGIVYAEDTMLGLEGLAFIKSTYRLESYPLLTSVISDLTGLPVVLVAHSVLPLLMIIWSASVLVLIHAALFPRQTGLVLIFHLLLLVALAGSLQSFGHHALPRYFHGKAPFLVVMVPLIAVLTTAALRNDDRRALLFLAGSMVVAIGMTANALYAAPLTAALVGLAFFFTKRGERWRTLRLPFAVIYPFALAAYLILFAPPGGSEREDTTTIGGTLWSVFGAPGIMVLGLSAIFFAAVLPLLNKRFTGLAFYVVAAFVFVLNPLLWPVYEDYVTGNINYRLFWTVPLPFLFAVGLGIIWRASNRVFRVALLIGLAILVLGPGSILWRADPGLHVRKVPSERFETATGLVDLLDKPSLLLAPEEISAWVPVLESAPYLVEAQRIYNPQREDERYTDILERRGSLFLRWSDKEVADFDPDDLATDLADLGVDAVLVDSNRAHHRASIESLEARGWSEAWGRGSYRLLTR